MALFNVVLSMYQEFELDLSDIDESSYRTQDTAIFFEKDLVACLKNVTYPLTIMFDELNH